MLALKNALKFQICGYAITDWRQKCIVTTFLPFEAMEIRALTRNQLILCHQLILCQLILRQLILCQLILCQLILSRALGGVLNQRPQDQQTPIFQKIHVFIDNNLIILFFRILVVFTYGVAEITRPANNCRNP